MLKNAIQKRTKDKPANKLGQAIIMQACLEMAEWKEQQILTKISNFLNGIGRGQQFGRFERQLKGEDKD